MNNIQYIESKGFQVKGRYIYKRSHKDNRLKVVGQLNESNFFLYNSNCYPFVNGVNFFDNSTLEDVQYINYVKEIKENERNDFNVSFEQYIDVTREASTFTDWLNETTKEKLNKEAVNYYDLRGVYNGYMENAVCFPFIDYDDNFITAQIIKYDSKGSRIKSQFSTNWFHSYKNIKESLDLKDKYSVSVKCFFGENFLKGSNNIVAIVEAPKTASILKEIYPNIDWIATAGETQIQNKNLDVLRGKRVVLFPDAHTTLWSDFAKNNNFFCSSVLENIEVKKGDDIADHIFDVKSPIHFELHNQLTDLNNGIIEWNDSYDEIQLNFSVVDDKQNYFTILPTTFHSNDLILKIDNSYEFKKMFSDKLFDIYEKEFVKEEGKRKGYEIYSAQVDWHSPKRTKEGFRLMNEAEFILSLQGCFRILKDLNPKIYKEVFEFSLIRFNESNFRFNIDYVKEVLVPLWDNSERDLGIFKKVRDWKYKGSDSLSRKEFEKELNNSRYRAKLNIRVLALNDVLSENRFIDLETDLAILNRKNNYKGLTELVSKWNEKVIGCKTYKSFVNQKVIEKCTKKAPAYIENHIWGGAKNVHPNISVSKISKITSIKNRATINHFLKFKRDEELAESIRNEVFHILNNIKDVVPIRQVIGDKRIIGFEVLIPEDKNLKMNNYNMLPKDVFSTLEELNSINDSRLNDVQRKVLEIDILYLELLNKIKSFSAEDKREFYKESHLRKEMLEQYLFKENNQEEEVKKLAIA